ncbi:MAG TPA: choice-of-anchor tandem repeat GloVer-containing protein, partial [Capsulimonadaceae bacterium]|nr:choice-of-anchor tandem repeat GloVer-containing protein [Capsulimonadaceae bacterium]
MGTRTIFARSALFTTIASLIVSSAPLLAAAQAKPAAKVTPLYTFSAVAADGTNSDGAKPSSITFEPSGDLIGTAKAGGSHAEGTIFKLTPQGQFRALHSFSALRGSQGANDDGAVPLSALTLGGDGLYYGVASAGGEGGAGTIFAISDTADLATLYS